MNIGAGLDGFEAIFIVSPRGHENDKDVITASGFSNPTANVNAGCARHHPIEKNHLRELSFFKECNRGLATLAGDNLMPELLEQTRGMDQTYLSIVDDKNFQTALPVLPVPNI